MSNKFIPRLYIKESLVEGHALTMDKNIAHYLRTVMRLDVHKCVYVFNDEDGEFNAKISHLSKSGATVDVLDKVRDPVIEKNVTLLCAPINKDRFRFVIEKGTELGVTHFRPVVTAHSNAPKIRIDKAIECAIAAAEQCERLSIPKIDHEEKLLRVLKGWDKNSPIIYCAESGDGHNIRECIDDIIHKDIGILVGPEGGFSEEEHAYLLQQEHIIPITMGPRIMRAETASIAMVSVVQAMVGDWNERIEMVSGNNDEY